MNPSKVKWSVRDVIMSSVWPHYTEDRILELWAERKNLGIAEVCELDIPAEDKVRLLVTAPGGAIEPAILAIVERAVRNYAAKCDVQIVKQWAQNWLSAEDRLWRFATTPVRNAFEGIDFPEAGADPAEGAVWAVRHSECGRLEEAVMTAAEAAYISADAWNGGMAAAIDRDRSIDREFQLQVADFRALVE